ncbi:hypothetical protein TKK_0012622 [Trichogramma kaykai]
MYKLDVSTWCYLKRRVENKKLNGVGLTLDNKDVDKFSDIVIRQNDESIHVNVNYTVLDEWKLSKCLSRLVPNLRNEIFYYLTNGKGKEIIQNFKDAGIDLRSLGNVMDSKEKKQNF